MKLLKDRSGYTLIYSLIFLTVILIIGSAVITRAHVALNIQNRNISQKQAYLNAKSAARILTKEISKTVTAVEYNSSESELEDREVISATPYGLTITPSQPVSSLADLVAKMIKYRATHPGEKVSFNLSLKEINTDIKCMFSDEEGFKYDFVAEITGRNHSENYRMFAEYVTNIEPNINSANEGDLYYYNFYEYRTNANIED
ncbi:MAG: hypothetical protein K0R18_914 [Bacillales bacterium]|jgi:type II secretory pathway pseudopilin PulG|nr:hypothetical protein [Bacillales bacterium]